LGNRFILITILNLAFNGYLSVFRRVLAGVVSPRLF